MKEKIRIVIADDHALVRDGIRARLELEETIEIVAEAEDGFQAIEKARDFQPDILMLDISMPNCNGLEAAEQIHIVSPDSRILFLSMHDNPEYVRAAVKSGASGFLLKDIGASDMVKAIETISQGGYYFSKNISVDALKPAKEKPENPFNLTEREIEVLRGIALGKANKEIAGDLGIGVRTVESHRQRMREKLGGGNAAQLTHMAMELGLVDKSTSSTLAP
ncbi:two component transcriptional regulator, LuxR family [Cohaesibacter marisflavi]|uniref:Two component transcriptional regulator, LuxR family n=1 Tax=Cohaesibacter marisflavi TaxID=655353 RepID=A0A1I5HP02_9HYPH|nr:response regulator transcription factor [Cohaesibacter marisflavi]SFO49551.1 two component transcriptional regulator, LuxR family [Cohaesibacter marisflavi]